jgi:hypothetical protein
MERPGRVGLGTRPVRTGHDRLVASDGAVAPRPSRVARATSSGTGTGTGRLASGTGTGVPVEGRVSGPRPRPRSGARSIASRRVGRAHCEVRRFRLSVDCPPRCRLSPRLWPSRSPQTKIHKYIRQIEFLNNRIDFYQNIFRIFFKIFSSNGNFS